MAFLVCLCVTALAACSDLPDSIPDIPPLQTAAPAPSLTLEPAPAATLTPPVATPTPIPTIAPSASTIILRLAIAPADTQTAYDRDEWKHWTDADGDCQNTRHEVLLSESTAPPEFKDSRQCQVVTGSWADPFTARVFTDPRDLDVDHMVPLANAHRSGGHAWDGERKRQYANHLAYEGHLVAVSRSANRSKGSRGPDEWRPPNQDYWCQYALDWATIKREWDLTATQSEADALSEMLDTCDTRIYIQAERRQAARIEPTPTPEPTPSPRTAPPTQVPVTSSLFSSLAADPNPCNVVSSNARTANPDSPHANRSTNPNSHSDVHTHTNANASGIPQAVARPKLFRLHELVRGAGFLRIAWRPRIRSVQTRPRRQRRAMPVHSRRALEPAPSKTATAQTSILGQRRKRFTRSGAAHTPTRTIWTETPTASPASPSETRRIRPRLRPEDRKRVPEIPTIAPTSIHGPKPSHSTNPKAAPSQTRTAWTETATA